MGFNNFIYFNYYFGFIHFCFLNISIFCILFFIALSFSIKKVEFEKLTPYECGFEPFETNTIFNIHFYIVGLSFLIFDLEVVFLYP
jgi:NADH-quinone oxidoreductase subunit A